MRSITSLALAAALVVAPALSAQVTIGRGSRVAVSGMSGDRAVLGIQTSSGGARDTLGLLVASVTAGGPADSAGIEEGHRIVAINGVNLRLVAADAGDPDMAGVLGRRLQRELDKATAGDVVELRVFADGQTRTVRVKTIRADQLQTSRTSVSRARVDDRPTLGASVGGATSARDTLGVFVVAVAEDGPLAKAGIYEGARIAAINGVDLRVPAADAGDEFMSGARVRRFQREVEKLTPGSNAELRVFFNGQPRTVTVQAVKRSDLKDTHSVTIFRSGGGNTLLFPSFDWNGPALDWNGFKYELQHEIPEVIRRSLDEAHGATQKAVERLRDGRIYQGFDGPDAEVFQRFFSEPARETRPLLREFEPIGQAPKARSSATGFESSATPSMFTFSPAVMTNVAAVDGESRVFTIAGVRLGPIDDRLASYLGAGSDRGFLVLEVDARWSGIRAGDVLLSIDGRPVRDGGLSRFAADLPGEYRVELLRAGKRATEVVRSH